MRLQIESHTETGNINKGERYVNGNENKKGEAGIALFTLAKSLKQPRCSSLDERIEMGVCVHSALGCHSAIKETDPAICNNTEGPRCYYVK